MRNKRDFLIKKPSYQLLNARFYHTSDVLDLMQEYAEEYHQSELLKLNKSDVRVSVCAVCGKKFVDVKKCYNVKCTNPFQTNL